MERLDTFLDWIDGTLDTQKRRHIAGGILMSVSLFFGGLAVTVITINKEEDKSEYEEYDE